jgi:hypothetical protein
MILIIPEVCSYLAIPKPKNELFIALKPAQDIAALPYDQT